MAVHRPSLTVAAVMMICVRGVLAQEPTAPPAHVVFVDGSAMFERAGAVDSLSSGLPLVAGDRLQTTAGRAELFFDDGSTLFVDESSTLDLLSPSALRLLAGGLTFEVSTRPRAATVMYQVDTPAGSVFLTAAGEYNIVGQADRQVFSTRVQVARGAADLISDTGRTNLSSGEESVVRTGEPPAFPGRFNSARWDSFGRWIEARRADRQVLSASRRYLPPAVQTYATTLDRYGSWVTDTQYGIVWYPTVDGRWRPYENGRWAWVAPFGWTWVGADAWAWPTAHYGSWCMNAVGSWFWVPGSVWGRAAPMILRQHGAPERVRRDSPRDFDRRPRSASMAPTPPGPSAGGANVPAQHDPLVRPLPPIGLPLPTLGLPPPHQSLTPSTRMFGVPSGPVVARGTQRRALVPQPAAPPPPSISQTRHLSPGWVARPTVAQPTVPPTSTRTAPSRPLFGARMASPVPPHVAPVP